LVENKTFFSYACHLKKKINISEISYIF